MKEYLRKIILKSVKPAAILFVFIFFYGAGDCLFAEGNNIRQVEIQKHIKAAKELFAKGDYDKAMSEWALADKMLKDVKSKSGAANPAVEIKSIAQENSPKIEQDAGSQKPSEEKQLTEQIRLNPQKEIENRKAEQELNIAEQKRLDLEKAAEAKKLAEERRLQAKKKEEKRKAEAMAKHEEEKQFAEQIRLKAQKEKEDRRAERELRAAEQKHMALEKAAEDKRLAEEKRLSAQQEAEDRKAEARARQEEEKRLAEENRLKRKEEELKRKEVMLKEKEDRAEYARIIAEKEKTINELEKKSQLLEDKLLETKKTAEKSPSSQSAPQNKKGPLKFKARNTARPMRLEERYEIEKEHPRKGESVLPNMERLERIRRIAGQNRIKQEHVDEERKLRLEKAMEEAVKKAENKSDKDK